jgi:glycyl-tRNA synthetase beta subunit
LPEDGGVFSCEASGDEAEVPLQKGEASNPGSPQILLILFESVSEKQRDEEIRKIGPSRQASFDSNGKPTKAAIGFAKGQSVPVESLEVIQTEKGEYVCAVKKELGKPIKNNIICC